MRWLVVGAGSAGCVVAAVLSQWREHDVVLLEAGPDRTAADRPAVLRSLNALGPASERAAWWGGAYRRGLGVGGTGAVNGMLALPALPADHERWVSDLGCAGWGWDDVAPWYAQARALTRQVATAELSPLDRALLAAARELGYADDVDLSAPGDGAGRVWVNADDVGRRSSAELWLDAARDRPNLEVRALAEVDRVVLDGGTARGVVLLDGSELTGDRVVLCAGAIGSPAILLRSGVRRRGVGRNLREHAYGSVSFRLEPAAQEWHRLPIGTALRTSSDSLQLLPVFDGGPVGRLLLVLLRSRSAGVLELGGADPRTPPVLDLRLLSHPGDRAAMGDGIATLRAVLSSQAFGDLVQAPTLDGVPASPDELGDPDVADAWLRAQAGDVAHACGTCRMGDPADPDAVVDLAGAVLGHRNLHVADASVLPDVPSTGTYLPTVVVAERLAAAWRDAGVRA